MNNGNAANNIGFSCRCTLIAHYTILGGGVKIYSSDFHSMNYMERRDYIEADIENRHCAPVTIGDDCFIGAGTIILKGVTIGDRVIIGAGSIVTRSIPADCVASGVPCKIIRNL